MQNVRSTCYQRITFSITAAEKASLSSLTLNLKYDDGAYIFLNGSVPLQRLNAPTTSPAFTDAAPTARADASAVIYQAIDLTPQIASLTTATPNILAIQGMNVGAADDDFLCSPQLVGGILNDGLPAAGALAYSSAFVLPQTGVVKARTLLNGQWSALTEASFIVGVPASSTNLTVSEFSYNPGAPSASEIAAGYTSSQMFEFVELQNISGGPVQLTGVHFDDGIKFDFTTGSATQQLAAGQRIVLASNPTALQFRYPGLVVAGTFAEDSNLSNGGERFELIAANGSTIFDFIYDDVAPWPTAPDGNGFTLVLINAMLDPELGLASNWRASAQSGGTPGGSDADTYAAWAGRNSVPATAGDDPDHNGLASLTEYALGFTPPAAPSGLISAAFENVTVVGVTATYIVLRYNQAANADDVRVTPEITTDYTTWIPMTMEVQPPVSLAGGLIGKAMRSAQPVSTQHRAGVRLMISTIP